MSRETARMTTKQPLNSIQKEKEKRRIIKSSAGFNATQNDDKNKEQQQQKKVNKTESTLRSPSHAHTNHNGFDNNFSVTHIELHNLLLSGVVALLNAFFVCLYPSSFQIARGFDN